MSTFHLLCSCCGLSLTFTDHGTHIIVTPCAGCLTMAQKGKTRDGFPESRQLGGVATVYHAGSSSYYRAALIKKLTPQELKKENEHDL